MNYYFDTEFIEHAGGVDLVSIGITTDEGREFYAESISFNPDLADDWVKENVLAKLKFTDEMPFKDYKDNGIEMCGTDEEIKIALLEFISEEIDPDPIFYAYFASYDWVVFARLFGRLIHKPKHFPMWVVDLKQMMWSKGLSKEWKREVCPDPEGAHDALVDARWNKKLHKCIMDDEGADMKQLKEVLLHMYGLSGDETAAILLAETLQKTIEKINNDRNNAVK